MMLYNSLSHLMFVADHILLGNAYGGRWAPVERSGSYTGCRSSTVSPSKLLLSCIRLSTVDARRTYLTLSCLLRPTRMYANFAPPLLGPLPSNEAGRSSEGVPSQWPAPTYGTVFPPPSVPSTPIQPSVVAQHTSVPLSI